LVRLIHGFAHLAAYGSARQGADDGSNRSSAAFPDLVASNAAQKTTKEHTTVFVAPLRRRAAAERHAGNEKAAYQCFMPHNRPPLFTDIDNNSNKTPTRHSRNLKLPRDFLIALFKISALQRRSTPPSKTDNLLIPRSASQMDWALQNTDFHFTNRTLVVRGEASLGIL
jgi:hypothetical protein